MPVLNPRISAVREDSRVCDQRSAVSAQPLNLRNFRLAEGHPRCPTGEFVTNRKLIALQKLPRKLLVLREGPDLTARFIARHRGQGGAKDPRTRLTAWAQRSRFAQAPCAAGHFRWTAANLVGVAFPVRLLGRRNRFQILWSAPQPRSPAES